MTCLSSKQFTYFDCISLHSSICHSWRIVPTFLGIKIHGVIPCQDYMKALGVTYHFLSKPLIEMAKCHLDPKKPSICRSAVLGVEAIHVVGFFFLYGSCIVMKWLTLWDLWTYDFFWTSMCFLEFSGPRFFLRQDEARHVATRRSETSGRPNWERCLLPTGRVLAPCSIFSKSARVSGVEWCWCRVCKRIPGTRACERTLTTQLDGICLPCNRLIPVFGRPAVCHHASKPQSQLIIFTHFRVHKVQLHSQHPQTLWTTSPFGDWLIPINPIWQCPSISIHLIYLKMLEMGCLTAIT